jgi:hypothetical protein
MRTPYLLSFLKHWKKRGHMSFFITSSSIKVLPSNLYNHTVYFVTCMSDSQQGFGLEIGFIDHFNTRLVTTLNYSTFTDLHTLRITREHTKSFPACNVFTSHFPVRASNSGDSSASTLTPFPAGHRLPTKSQLNYSIISSQSPLQNSTDLTAPIVPVITSKHGTHRKCCTLFLCAYSLPQEHVYRAVA